MYIDQLKIALEKAHRILKVIKIKYIGLSGYLVFTSQSGQCYATIDLMEILKDCPDMIEESAAKEKALAINKTLNAIKKEGKAITGSSSKLYENWENAMTESIKVMDELAIKDDILVELRFTKANLPLIHELKKDKLVSALHTPQTKASIRIVLGTLKVIYRKRKIN
ncbi:MAG: hypothetical protein AB2L12_11275 [Smithellaceae bacterium]